MNIQCISDLIEKYYKCLRSKDGTVVNKYIGEEGGLIRGKNCFFSFFCFILEAIIRCITNY